MNRRPWTDEFGPIIDTLRILVRSQLGYQVRHIDFKYVFQIFLKTATMKFLGTTIISIFFTDVHIISVNFCKWICSDSRTLSAV